MTEQIRTEYPCIRGCAWQPTMPDEEPRPKPARHGKVGDGYQLCDSCFHRMRHVLDAVPEMIANMRLMVVPTRAANYEGDRVQSGHDGSPAPLRVAPLDASDALFAKLISWVDALAPEIRATVPSIRVWMGPQEVQGFRPVSAASAHHIAGQLTAWLLSHLEQIAASSSAIAFHDDICWGWDDSPGVYKLTGQYGIEPRPLRAAEKRECPVCGRDEVFVKWPDTLDPDLAIMCGRCKWVAEPEKYGHYAKLFAV